MKKIYILCASLLCFQLSEAQITLTTANNSIVLGDVFNRTTTDATSLSPGQPGANQTWNFPSLPVQFTDNVTVVAPSTLSDNANHPTANISDIIMPGNIEDYYISDNTQFSQVGVFIPGTLRITSSDPREIIKYPITFGNTFSETFSQVFTNFPASQTSNRSGTISITADGYGDLVLPFGTITNVLRVKNIAIYTDVVVSPPFTTNVEDTVYFWYNSATHLPILTFQILNSGFGITKTIIALDQSSVITSLGDDFIPNNPITIFPNPTSNNQTTILLDKMYEKAQLQVIDITGKIVKMENISSALKNVTLNLDGLNKGIYFVQIIHDNALVSSEKLVLN